MASGIVMLRTMRRNPPEPFERVTDNHAIKRVGYTDLYQIVLIQEDRAFHVDAVRGRREWAVMSAHIHERDYQRRQR